MRKFLKKTYRLRFYVLGEENTSKEGSTWQTRASRVKMLLLHKQYGVTSFQFVPHGTFFN